VVQASSRRQLAGVENLANSTVFESEIAGGLATENSTHSPGIDIDLQAGAFGKLDQLADGVFVIKLVVFGKGVENKIAMMIDDFFKINQKVAGIAIAKVTDSGSYGEFHNGFAN
jgi:hypothetical protein